jgi:hypothetical protein
MRCVTLGSYGMKSARLQTKGFTLIASLLLLLLLSGIAIGLMMMVNTEGKVGGTDLQNNAAYHSAEGGIEKMTADLAATFQNAQSPTATQICNLSTLQPTIAGVTWKDYTVTPGPVGQTCPTALTSQFGQISSGPNQGLWAQIIPVNMLATAAEPGGQEVSMTRSAQVALIPVFQFGVFSESDLGFFSSPDLNFAGRVHTNGDLYLGVANCCTLTFHDKLKAYGNVITKVLPNGLAASSYNDSGTVLIPQASQGCDSTQPNCRALGQSEGSVTGAGGNPPQSGQNSSWPTLSLSTYNAEIIDGNYGNTGGTGAKKLSMPFVNGTLFPFEIIRRPPSGESPTSALGASREYNMSQIRVLLTDDPAELPGGASDANNIRLANVGGASPSNQFGIPTSFPAGLPVLAAGNTYNTYFAAASNAATDPSACGGAPCPTQTGSVDWPLAPATPAGGAQTLVPFGPPAAPVTVAGTNPAPTIALCPPAAVAPANRPAGCPATAPPYPYTAVGNAANTATWNLIDGYLRVEYKDVSGNWNPVTLEWLKLGFARGVTPPTAPGANTVNPNAILLLQEPADRNGDLAIDPNGIAPVCTKTVAGVCTVWKNPLPPEVVIDAVSTSPYFGVTNSATTTQSVSINNWYPINFYDAREGEPRDITYTGGQANSCTTNGVMNAVELDVGNLKRWLTGAIGTSGTSVDYLAQNGYVLYFSDRRGMLKNPNYTRKTGESGLEDVVNSSSAAGTPDGLLEPIPAGKTYSPEDVNQNGLLDEFGPANMGLGQWVGAVNQNAQIIAATPDNPYTPRITSCSVTGRKSWVSGARHVLKLVDGALGNVPLRTDTTPNSGGFTVAAENPVYIQGNYNSSSTDPFWTGGADAAGHAATSVIADAVTVLSNAWVDQSSMLGTPTQAAGNRTATTTYYRVAVAGGKNMSFPFPSWETSTDYGFGTDGGVHNFLRFLEDWSGGPVLNYGGSLVSLYYATYNTGLFKCCNYAVYQPPTRNYIFDSDFTNPAGLPPGTPLFRDVDSLGYRQVFTARTK